MAERMPPLNPLRTFVAASRHESFSKTAETLNVTQAAVSRQIAVLEGFLGVELFHRDKRNVTLTKAGLEYARAMGQAFEIIGAGTADIMFETARDTLNVRAYTTFASLWLVPRLARFRALHPDLRLNVTTSAAAVDFEHENVDVAIQIGMPDAAAGHSEPLFPVVLKPICTAAVQAEFALREPRDLAHAPILQSVYRRGDWRAWLKKAQVTSLDLNDCMHFESSGLAYRAAQAGMGVAIGHVPLMNADITSGSLVTPFDLVLRRRYAYCLLYERRRNLPRRVSLFRDWIHAEAVSGRA